jgi:hypothetical protein
MALWSTQPLTEMSTWDISWGVNAAGAYGWQPTTFMCRLSRNLGASTSWNPVGLSRPVVGLLYKQYHFPLNIISWWPLQLRCVIFFFSFRAISGKWLNISKLPHPRVTDSTDLSYWTFMLNLSVGSVCRPQFALEISSFTRWISSTILHISLRRFYPVYIDASVTDVFLYACNFNAYYLHVKVPCLLSGYSCFFCVMS